MKKITLNLFVVLLLSVSCSKYDRYAIKEVVPPSEDVPKEPIAPVIERINRAGNLDNLELEIEVNSDEAFVFWENSDEINVYITKKMPDGRYDFIQPNLRPIKSGNFLIPKEMELEGKDLLVSLEKNNKIVQSKKISFELPSKFDEIYDFFPSIPVNTIGNGNRRAEFDSFYPGTNGSGRISGGMSFNEDGTVLYVSDKNNRRVLIYANQEAIKCKEDFKNAEDLKNACLYLTKNERLRPFAVLGQSHFYSSGYCNNLDGLPQHSCLNGPTDVLFKNGKLYISDTNNNRVVIFDKAPLYGCHNIKSLLGEETPVECKPDRVIGKKSLEDRTFSFDTTAALSSPMGLDIFNGDLYVADNGNSRVVIVKGADNPEKWNCNEGNFGAEGCSFSAVLGQESPNSYDDYWTYFGDTITTDFENGKIVDPDGHFKRLMYAPMDVKVTKEGFVIVASNEDYWDGEYQNYNVEFELYSRILIFKDLQRDEDGSPTCRNDDFANKRCDASLALGNDDFNQLFNVEPANGPSYYSEAPFGIERFSSMDIYGDTLVITSSQSNKFLIYEDYKNLTPENYTPTIEVSNYFDLIPSSEITHIIYSDKRKSLFVLDGNRGVLDEYSLQLKPLEP